MISIFGADGQNPLGEIRFDMVGKPVFFSVLTVIAYLGLHPAGAVAERLWISKVISTMVAFLFVSKYEIVFHVFINL